MQFSTLFAFQVDIYAHIFFGVIQQKMLVVLCEKINRRQKKKKKKRTGKQHKCICGTQLNVNYIHVIKFVEK